MTFESPFTLFVYGLGGGLFSSILLHYTIGIVFTGLAHAAEWLGGK